MPRLIIQFVRHPHDRELLFRVALHSKEDTTPREHEQDHARLVRALFPSLNLTGDPGPRFTVERERPQQEPIIGCSGDDDGYEVIDIG